MKKKFRFVLILSMTFIMLYATSYAVTFSDLSKEHWAYNNIMNLVEQNVINGYTDGTYKPEKEVTRGEFFKLIMTALYEGNEFFEINNMNFGHWASPYVIEATMQGYMMNGASIDGLDNYITRQEMVHILARVCIKNEIKSKVFKEIIEFSDINDLDKETSTYINYVVMNGLINGYTDGTFKANKSMTRAEVATVINRFISLKNDGEV